ncbi:uncharacterized protein [Argopecten irradians]|uniref:uncharacterized protein n=1 Tax=Argopecten irradians TaxID=31199 RepID=UPI0037135A5A
MIENNRKSLTPLDSAMMASIWLVQLIALPSLVRPDCVITDLADVTYVAGFKLRTGVFLILDTSAYSGCVRECLLRKHCVSITYHLRDHYCHLGSQGQDLERVGDSRIISSHPTDWNPQKSIARNCSDNPCTTCERCTQLSSGVIVCVPVSTECVEPKELTTVKTDSHETTTVINNDETTVIEDAGTTAIENADTTVIEDAGTTAIENAGTTVIENADTTALENVDTTVIENAGCVPNFNLVDGTYCIQIVGSKLSPAKAETHCQEKNGRLIWMTSVEKFDAIVTVIDSGKYALAGTDEADEGTWRLPNGQQMDWVESRANKIGHKNKNCLHYDASSGVLIDHNCNAAVSFICEIP